MLNTKEKLCPLFRFPLSKAPVLTFTVWEAESLFVQVTLVPLAIVINSGLKANPEMSTFISIIVGVASGVVVGTGVGEAVETGDGVTTDVAAGIGVKVGAGVRIGVGTGVESGVGSGV